MRIFSRYTCIYVREGNKDYFYYKKKKDAPNSEKKWNRKSSRLANSQLPKAPLRGGTWNVRWGGGGGKSQLAVDTSKTKER